MKLFFTVATAAVLLTFLSCNQSGTSESRDRNAIAPIALQEKPDLSDGMIQFADTVAQATQNINQSPGKTKQSQRNEDWNKKIVKNGTVNLEVKNYQKYYQLVSEVVKREGGYIAQEDQQQNEYKLENTVVVKVPVALFEEAMDLISKGTGQEEVKVKKITSEDVTTEVIDTKSRIEAKRGVRSRYLDLLKQAKNMGEILQVETEINEIQEQMEMAAGRVNYLNNVSMYSTINLTFYQIINVGAKDEKDPSFSTKIFTAFLSGWQFIKAIILGLVSIWPLWFLMFGLWLGIRKWKIAKAKA